MLSIAGTDPTGGAGIQADLKSIAAHGGYGMAVVTALVAQNTQGVRSIHQPPPEFLREQLLAVSDDVRVDAVKIGMLGDTATVEVVADWLPAVPGAVVVLDPVMVATSGHRLLDADAEKAVRELVPHADLVTPNLPELAVLLDVPVAEDWADALEQARELSRRTGRWCWPRAVTCRAGRARMRSWTSTAGCPAAWSSCPATGWTPRTPTAPAARCRRRWPPGWPAPGTGSGHSGR